MAGLGRPGLTASQRSELWDRWKRGESLTEIGDAIGKHSGSVFGVLRTGGGIYRPPRTRSITQLSLSEREEISRGVSAGCSMRAIARQINRAPATVQAGSQSKIAANRCWKAELGMVTRADFWLVKTALSNESRYACVS